MSLDAAEQRSVRRAVHGSARISRCRLPVPCFGSVGGSFNCALLPGLLPHGLRRLQLCRAFNCPLLPGSIPSTVEVLDADAYNQPLLVQGVSVLPSSLVHLVLERFQQPLVTCHPSSFSSKNDVFEQLESAFGGGEFSLHLYALCASTATTILCCLERCPAGLTHLVLGSLLAAVAGGRVARFSRSVSTSADRFQHPLLPGQQQERTTLIQRRSLACRL